MFFCDAHRFFWTIYVWVLLFFKPCISKEGYNVAHQALPKNAPHGAFDYLIILQTDQFLLQFAAIRKLLSAIFIWFVAVTKLSE